ncbi:MAG TPA: D-alanyl-D-alanine carboxypeptidase [bacterium]|nr:D-alanyl-D-alanine carboxypeptidase [bacterium]HPN29354.1 D-alanyl-D-alanine carboxypeptidase [bacterium]
MLNLFLKKFSAITLLLIIFELKLAGIPLISNKAAFELPDAILSLIQNGAVLVTDRYDNILLKYNENEPFTPASTIKIITSYFALSKLGENYRFYTDVFFDSVNNDLYVKGYGDPFLVSEEIKSMAEQIGNQIKTVRNIYVDDSYFEDRLIIPGKGKTLNPYDSPNGALSANFNTIAAKYNNRKKIYQSIERETPITDFSAEYLKKIKFRGSSRINLKGSADLPEKYFGSLLSYFLKETGVEVKGRVWKKKAINQNFLFRHYNRTNLADIINKIMISSNNFMINQIFLHIGARDFGEPATLDKSVESFNNFIKYFTGVSEIKIKEASGLSRENKINCLEMNFILNLFQKYKNLMRTKNEGNFKTGTLSGVYSIAGYYDSPRFGELKIIIFLQQKNNRRNVILKKIIDFIEKQN